MGGASAKRKGTAFEYLCMYALRMLSFYVMRAYSSAGVADLVATPSWNPMGNDRPLLIQCKNSETKKDYIAPFERAHLDYLQQINSGLVVLIYKDGGECMVKTWGNQKKFTFNQFMQKTYGIPCDFKELIKRYKMYSRPLHLYPPPKDKDDKFVAPFADLYSLSTWYPHVPEKWKEKHI